MPTTYRRNLRFSPKPEVRLDNFAFDGGLITDAHETKLKANESPNIEDAVFTETGSIKTRPGYTKYNSSSLGANAITGLIRFYGSGGIAQTICKYTTGLYRGNDSTGAMTAITLGSGVSLTSSAQIDWTIVNGTLLVVDGTNYIQKYRGSTNASYTTGTVSLTNGSPTVTGSGTTWTTSTNAEAGEYMKLPDGKWYKILSIADNTTIVLETDYLGATASGQSYTISPWGEVQGKLDSASANSSLVRPTPKFIENHANRVWTLEDNKLRFSALDTSVGGEHFNDWDTANNAGAINLPSNAETTTTGLKSFDGALYVLQRRAIWRLNGTAPANFELKLVSGQTGCASHRTIVEVDDFMIFLSEEGLIAFDGVNIQNLSRDKVNVLIDSWANKTSTAAVLWDGNYIIAYTPNGGSANTHALVYDIQKAIFTKFTNFPANVFVRWDGGADSGQVYFGGSSVGHLYRWDSGTDDAGTDITTIYDTPSLGFEANVNDKTLKKFYVQQVAVGDWNMTVRMYTDITTGPTSTTINLSPGSLSLWGTMVWGDNWSSEGELITTRVADFQGLAKFFKFRFESADSIEVLGITVTERARRL